MASPEPDIEAVRRCLQEAGLLEENMSEDAMRQYYKAIKESEESLIEETKNRENSFMDDETETQLSEDLGQDKEVDRSSNQSQSEEIDVSGSQEKSFTPKQWLSKRATTITNREETSSFRNDENAPAKTRMTTKTMKQEFNSMDPCNCAPFKPMFKPYFPPVKRGYPIYCHPSVLRLPPTERSKVIEHYHEKFLQHYQEVQLQSKNYAPWPKSICITIVRNKSESTVVNNNNNNNNNNSNNNKNKRSFLEMEAPSCGAENSSQTGSETCFYTSRSGRRTKRKLYLESEVISEEIITELEDYSSFLKKRKTPPEPLKKTPSPARKRQTNEEIMKKSKLFAEPQKRSRREEIFEKVKEENMQRKLDEERMQQFTLSLQNPDENDDVGNFIHQDEPFQRPKRSYNKKQAKNQGTTTSATRSSQQNSSKAVRKTQHSKNNEASNASNSNYPPLDVFLSNTNNRNSSKSDKPEASAMKPTTTSLTNHVQREACPMCNVLFDLDQLMIHASHCGDVVEEPPAPSKKNYSSIMCEVCDKMFTLNTEYEVHVYDCINARKGFEIS